MPPVKNVGKRVRENRMHGLTGGGWKRKRHRPWLKRKLPAGKPRQERQTYSRTTRHRASPRPS